MIYSTCRQSNGLTKKKTLLFAKSQQVTAKGLCAFFSSSKRIDCHPKACCRLPVYVATGFTSDTHRDQTPLNHIEKCKELSCGHICSDGAIMWFLVYATHCLNLELVVFVGWSGCLGVWGSIGLDLRATEPCQTFDGELAWPLHAGKNEHGTLKWKVCKEVSFLTGSFLGSMLVFGSVFIFGDYYTEVKKVKELGSFRFLNVYPASIQWNNLWSKHLVTWDQSSREVSALCIGFLCLLDSHPFAHYFGPSGNAASKKFLYMLSFSYLFLRGAIITNYSA